MPDALDQSPDIKDSNDNSQASKPLTDEVGRALSDASPANNSSLIDYYRKLADNSSANLHDAHIGEGNSSYPSKAASSDDTSPSSNTENNKTNGTNKVEDTSKAEANKVDDLSAAKNPDGTFNLDKLLNKTEITKASTKVDPEKLKELEKAVKMRWALEAENVLILSGLGSPLVRAADNLRTTAGADLPEGFENDLESWVAFNERQRLANEEAERLGLKDKNGDPLRFPCMTEDQMADQLQFAADAYTKFASNDLSGSAAEAYNNHPGDFVQDWQSIVTMGLQPIREDYQGQMGTCAGNTQLVAGWTQAGDKMMAAHCAAITQGYYENGWGEKVFVNADQLGRGYTNGQNPANFIGNSLLSDAAYGRPHYNGNNIEVMDEALEVLTDGWSVSNIDGAYHELSPGHSMVGMNIVDDDGSIYEMRINHWLAPWQDWGEPLEGMVKDYGHINLRPVS